MLSGDGIKVLLDRGDDNVSKCAVVVIGVEFVIDFGEAGGVILVSELHDESKNDENVRTI